MESGERILFAMVGASDPDGKPSGYMSQGTCVPLAATERVREVIEELGEDAVADWLDANDIASPKAGGLWVAELEFEQDPDAPQGYAVEMCVWRAPSVEELEGVIAKQTFRARRERVEAKPFGTAAWTWYGALV